MELIRDCFSLDHRFPGSALTIGNFDGVHIGHQKILAETVEAARAAGTPALVFTFEPHPLAVMHPERAPRRIMVFERKLELLEEAGADAVICPDDGAAVLQLSAEEFVRRIIVDALAAQVLVEGPSFHFGHRQKGNEAMLRQAGRQLGFELKIVPPVTVAGCEVSSTRIREAVGRGLVAEARKMLGRPFEFVGRVVRGKDRGRSLGYPTVNISGGDFLVPADGVYAGRARLAGGTYGAAISVGHSTTFGDQGPPVVEAYLLDFEGQVYGQEVGLQFCRRIRDQETFADAQALSRQIGGDCREVRRVLASGG